MGLDIILILLKLSGFVMNFWKSKKDKQDWMVKAADSLHDKGMLTSRQLLELEKQRSDAVDKILDAMPDIIVPSMKIKTLTTMTIGYIPKYGSKNTAVKTIQYRLVKLGFDLGRIDGDFGRQTKAALSLFQRSKGLPGSGVIGPKTLRYLNIKILAPEPIKGAPPWYTYAKKFEGKNERDKEFAKFMIPQWRLVGLSLKRIDKKWAAWCGLAMAVALSGAGLEHARNGAAAKNWAKFGTAIEWKVNGIPRGSVIHVNSKCGSGSGNHVTQADGSCTAKHLLKKGATFNGYGGNQGNMWKTSTYGVYKICAVRWPSDYPYPGKVLKNDKCTSGKDNNESTR